MLLQEAVFSVVVTIGIGIYKFLNKKTYFSEQCYKLSLPGTWHEISKTEESTQYATRSGKECITVSPKFSAKPLQLGECHRVREIVVKGGIKTINKMHGCNLNLSVEKKEQRGMLTAFYWSKIPDKNRHFAEFVVVSRNTLVMFHYEAFDMCDKAFDKRRRQLIGKVQVANFSDPPPEV